jgi:sugar lactone lactonase YvrE
MRNFDELQQRIARGEQIPRAEMAERYFPLAADHDRLVQWLRGKGIEILRTDENRVAVFARGPVSVVAQALDVTFARVIGRDGGEYTSAITAPSLPGDVSPAVLGIHGLQQHIRQRPLALPRQVRPDLTVTVGGYYPSQIAQAYNANGLTATGSGQTIAIYALGYPMSSDLTAFWQTVGVSQSLSNIQQVDVAGGPGASPDPEIIEEATLDTEWASALAPAATIRIYAANEADPGENDEILQQIYADLPSQPSLHQLCICIGGDEAEDERDYLIIEAQYMANLASGGVSVFVASGDNGAYDDPINASLLTVTTPTSDPDVTGVGGTTLVLSGGTVTSETAWSGSGGGESVVFSRPPWQTGIGVPAGVTRLVPDVAAAADPQNGAYIYSTAVANGAAVVGGTSWATPVWTAFCALLNQGRSTPLGLLNPRIYPLIGSSAFRDITSGDNRFYNAGVGYDMCTGIGVPDMAALSTASLSATTTVNIPAQLGNVFTTVGQPATFFVVAQGAADYSYSWQRLPIGTSTWEAVSDNSTFSGSLTATLVVNNTTAAMSGDEYRCTVTSGSQSATSTPPATLTVSGYGVTTIAGWPGSVGSANGTGWEARFAYPGSVRTDSAGNVYVADSYNNTVRKVTPNGVATTVGGVAGKSGNTNGPVATALLNETAGAAVDASGNLFVADNGNYEIREISASGTVTTLAGSGAPGVVDGAGTAASFFDPQNLAIDTGGNLYVADGMGNVIRKVTPSGQVSTFAGAGVSGRAGPAGSQDGTGSAAEFNDPTGIAVDVRGNLYVADAVNDTIRMINPAGVVTTLAGSPGLSGSADGSGPAARFSNPAGVGVDAVGNVYVADNGNNTIRMITPEGVVTTLAGSAGSEENIDGLPGNARFAGPGDVTIDNSGIIYVADSQNMTIRRIIPASSATLGISTQPESAAVNLGSMVVFAVGPAGYAPFSYQWYFNGGAVIGATGPSYTLDNVQTADAGSYTVIVSNASGSVTSSPAVLTVNVPAGDPQISAQPQGGTLTAGGSVGLSVSVTGNGPFSYQWYVNGGAIAGATAPTYNATTIGSYTLAVSNAAATVTSDAAVVTSGSRLINISTRALVGTGGNITIAGIYIDGPSSEYKQLVIRGVGPTLSQFNVSGALSATTISVFDTSGNVIVSNTGWGNAPVAGNSSVEAAFEQATANSMRAVGAFALPAGSADSALVADLPRGSYTVQMTGVGDATGVGLVEVYEANTSDPAVMTDISTRAQVGTGSNTLIAGFVVTGTQPATVLVRGDGPALKAVPFSVPGTLAQPVVSVYDGNSMLIASNQGWANNPKAGGSTVAASFRAATAADFSSAGAFPLASGSLDSALVLTLPPGAYSAWITSADGTLGVALAEVYQLEP